MNKRIVLFFTVFVLYQCSFFTSVGGKWVSDGKIELTFNGKKHDTTVFLTIGEFGGEISGFIVLPEFPECSCSYVEGEYNPDSRELLIAFDYLKSGNRCNVKLFAKFQFYKVEGLLKGKFYEDYLLKSEISPEVILYQKKTQKVLTDNEKNFQANCGEQNTNTHNFPVLQ